MLCIDELVKRVDYLEKEIDTMRTELCLAYAVIDQLPESALEQCKSNDLLKLMQKTEQTSKLEMVQTGMDDRLTRMKEQNKKLRDLVRDLLDRIAAKENLLVAYRLGNHGLADRALAKLDKLGSVEDKVREALGEV